jgi:hypothetical protein
MMCFKFFQGIKEREKEIEKLTYEIVKTEYGRKLLNIDDC